jgi:hypothetical protein
VLGWLHGAWCEPADLDRLSRLRSTRVLDASGALRFRHWRLYAERGLAGARVAVWVWDGTLTVEYAADTLAQYPVTVEADGRGLRGVGEPHLFPHRHSSPQPCLPLLEETTWHPVRRLDPYRRRRSRVGEGRQEPLFSDEPGASVG